MVVRIMLSGRFDLVRLYIMRRRRLNDLVNGVGWMETRNQLVIKADLKRRLPFSFVFPELLLCLFSRIRSCNVNVDDYLVLSNLGEHIAPLLRIR